MEKLPDDVLSNIFVRLFAKQLAQMRSVSKPWNDLLSNKSLIKSHLDHSIHNNEEVLLFFYYGTINYEPFSAQPSRSPNLELINFIKTPVNIHWEGASVVGSVNGLICLDDSPHRGLHIWNPSLSAISTLPPFSLPYPATGNGPITTDFRFGFDPKADDYKVVKLASFIKPKGFVMERVQEWLHIEVYSMRKASWKLIIQTPPSHITGIICSLNRFCADGLDGLLHWIGIIGKEKKRQTIVAFDLDAETFHEIPLPDSILLHHNVSNRINLLGVLARKLCVMSYVEDGECEVWVMDEYGVVESWVKHHAFSQFRYIRPSGFTLCNQFLFEVETIDTDDDHHETDDDDDGDRCFSLYDPVAAKTQAFKVCIPIKAIVGYVDSLVWVSPDERVMS